MTQTELLEQILPVLQRMEDQQTASIRLMREWFDHEKAYIEEIRARAVEVDTRDAQRSARIEKDSTLFRERTVEIREREKRLDGRESTIAELDAVMFLRSRGYIVRERDAPA